MMDDRHIIEVYEIGVAMVWRNVKVREKICSEYGLADISNCKSIVIGTGA